ncbi:MULTISPECIES: 30S ribosomal protein S20 [Parvimonas]|uniref:Small ribosomal subunit protein bS20 n=1 Tax=Parvimonas parva TaxID=2769485 RepID=A0ABS1CB40_9FIRM|nr:MULTISPECIES: 30S ribosomal protein S20 [Parvimonas]KXB67266.1 ribosomal protein S20 [Parvimonas sp. KA00067]MBK1469276.1 30S ribosomal protein S20 [Parvimonas parva]
MANIKSALKRIDVTKKQTLKNKSRKSEIKTYIKKFNVALEESNLETANELLKTIDKRLKQATVNSVFHKNAASRQVSKLSKKLHQASTQA